MPNFKQFLNSARHILLQQSMQKMKQKKHKTHARYTTTVVCIFVTNIYFL